MIGNVSIETAATPGRGRDAYAWYPGVALVLAQPPGLSLRTFQVLGGSSSSRDDGGTTICEAFGNPEFKQTPGSHPNLLGSRGVVLSRDDGESGDGL